MRPGPRSAPLCVVHVRIDEARPDERVANLDALAVVGYCTLGSGPRARDASILDHNHGVWHGRLVWIDQGPSDEGKGAGGLLLCRAAGRPREDERNKKKEPAASAARRQRSWHHHHDGDVVDWGPATEEVPELSVPRSPFTQGPA